MARRDIVKTAIKTKFEQNLDMKKKLLATDNAFLAEANPNDKIWGIGLDEATARQTFSGEWPGENLLGWILMEVRDELRSE